ncbi:MAG: ROK family protein, partial [Candidatus Omnitrophota bacterium]|nr:ROK family protein [Candidatus Omnitrophota bacterium]
MVKKGAVVYYEVTKLKPAKPARRPAYQPVQLTPEQKRKIAERRQANAASTPNGKAASAPAAKPAGQGPSSGAGNGLAALAIFADGSIRGGAIAFLLILSAIPLLGWILNRYAGKPHNKLPLPAPEHQDQAAPRRIPIPVKPLTRPGIPDDPKYRACSAVGLQEADERTPEEIREILDLENTHGQYINGRWYPDVNDIRKKYNTLPHNTFELDTARLGMILSDQAKFSATTTAYLIKCSKKGPILYHQEDIQVAEGVETAIWHFAVVEQQDTEGLKWLSEGIPELSGVVGAQTMEGASASAEMNRAVFEGCKEAFGLKESNFRGNRRLTLSLPVPNEENVPVKITLFNDYLVVEFSDDDYIRFGATTTASILVNSISNGDVINESIKSKDYPGNPLLGLGDAAGVPQFIVTSEFLQWLNEWLNEQIKENMSSRQHFPSILCSPEDLVGEGDIQQSKSEDVSGAAGLALLAVFCAGALVSPNTITGTAPLVLALGMMALPVGEAKDFRYIGITLGGNKLAVAICDGNSRIVAGPKELRWDDDPRFNNKQIKNIACVEPMMETIIGFIAELIKDGKIDVAMIGAANAAIAGPVDNRKGIAGSDFKTPNLPLDRYPFRDELCRRAAERGINGLTVELLNDAEAAVKGETYAPEGRLKDYPDGGIVIIGGGINIAIKKNGRIYFGERGDIKEAGHNLYQVVDETGGVHYAWGGKVALGHHPVEAGNTPEKILRKGDRLCDEYVALMRQHGAEEGRRRFLVRHPAYPIINYGAGLRDFEDRLSGPSIRARIANDACNFMEQPSPEKRREYSDYLAIARTAKAQQRKGTLEYERVLTPLAQQGNLVARQWIARVAEEIGQALAAFIAAYQKEEFVKHLVLVSGVNENLGKGVYESPEDEQAGLDLFIKHLRSSVERELLGYFHRDSGFAHQAAQGIVRSRMDYRRELVCYQPAWRGQILGACLSGRAPRSAQRSRPAARGPPLGTIAFWQKLFRMDPLRASTNAWWLETLVFSAVFISLFFWGAVYLFCSSDGLIVLPAAKLALFKRLFALASIIIYSACHFKVLYPARRSNSNLVPEEHRAHWYHYLWFALLGACFNIGYLYPFPEAFAAAPWHDVVSLAIALTLCRSYYKFVSWRAGMAPLRRAADRGGRAAGGAAPRPGPSLMLALGLSIASLAAGAENRPQAVNPDPAAYVSTTLGTNFGWQYRGRLWSEADTTEVAKRVLNRLDDAARAGIIVNMRNRDAKIFPDEHGARQAGDAVLVWLEEVTKGGQLIITNTPQQFGKISRELNAAVGQRLRQLLIPQLFAAILTDYGIQPAPRILEQVVYAALAEAQKAGESAPPQWVAGSRKALEAFVIAKYWECVGKAREKGLVHRVVKFIPLLALAAAALFFFRRQQRKSASAQKDSSFDGVTDPQILSQRERLAKAHIVGKFPQNKVEDLHNLRMYLLSQRLINLRKLLIIHELSDTIKKESVNKDRTFKCFLVDTDTGGGLIGSDGTIYIQNNGYTLNGINYSVDQIFCHEFFAKLGLEHSDNVIITSNYKQSLWPRRIISIPDEIKSRYKLSEITKLPPADKLPDRAFDGTGQEPDGLQEVFAAAPGRFNIIGEHVDYPNFPAEGLIKSIIRWILSRLLPQHVSPYAAYNYSLPAALEARMCLLGAQGGTGLVEIHSSNFKQKAQFSLSQLSIVNEELGRLGTTSQDKRKREEIISGFLQGADWAKYFLGVCFAARERGLALRGGKYLIAGNVPLGAGTSSSAAYCVAVGLGLNELFGWNLPKAQIARLAQAGEHSNFVGSQCGLLDQTASLFSKKGSAILLNYGGLERVREVPLNTGEWEFVLVNSNVARELAQTAYNDRVEELKAAPALFNALLCPKVNILEKILLIILPKTHISSFTLDDLQRIEQELKDIPEVALSPERKVSGEIILKRARHVLSDRKRVLAFMQAIQKGNIETCGRILNESGDSLSMEGDYQISGEVVKDGIVYHPLDTLVRIGRGLGAYGRMMGGGGGGCAIFLVRSKFSAQWKELVADEYKRSMELLGLKATFIEARPSEGAKVSRIQKTSGHDRARRKLAGSFRCPGGPAVGAGPNSKPLRVLVVDNEAMWRDIAWQRFEKYALANSIQYYNNTIEEAVSGEDAWQKIEAAWKEGNPYDIICTDKRMGEITGLDLAGKIREKEQGTPHCTYIMLHSSEGIPSQEATQVDDIIRKYTFTPKHIGKAARSLTCAAVGLHVAGRMPWDEVRRALELDNDSHGSFINGRWHLKSEHARTKFNQIIKEKAWPLFRVDSPQSRVLPAGAPKINTAAAAYLIQCSAKVQDGKYDLLQYQTTEVTPDAEKLPICHIAVVNKQDISGLKLEPLPDNKIPPLTGKMGAVPNSAAAPAPKPGTSIGIPLDVNTLAEEQGVALTPQTKVILRVSKEKIESLFLVELNRFLASTNQDAAVLSCVVREDELGRLIEDARGNQQVAQLIIVDPFKITAAEVVRGNQDDCLDPRAELTRAADCLTKNGNKWEGKDLEGEAFWRSCVWELRGLGKEIDLRKSSVLLVGCGGAGRAIGAELLQWRVQTLYFVDKDKEKTRNAWTLFWRVVTTSKNYKPVRALQNDQEIASVFAQVNLVINSSGKPLPDFPYSSLKEGAVVVDLAETKFLENVHKPAPGSVIKIGSLPSMAMRYVVYLFEIRGLNVTYDAILAWMRKSLPKPGISINGTAVGAQAQVDSSIKAAAPVKTIPVKMGPFLSLALCAGCLLALYAVAGAPDAVGQALATAPALAMLAAPAKGRQLGVEWARTNGDLAGSQKGLMRTKGDNFSTSIKGDDIAVKNVRLAEKVKVSPKVGGEADGSVKPSVAELDGNPVHIYGDETAVPNHNMVNFAFGKVNPDLRGDRGQKYGNAGPGINIGLGLRRPIRAFYLNFYNRVSFALIDFIGESNRLLHRRCENSSGPGTGIIIGMMLGYLVFAFFIAPSPVKISPALIIIVCLGYFFTSFSRFLPTNVSLSRALLILSSSLKRLNYSTKSVLRQDGVEARAGNFIGAEPNPLRLPGGGATAACLSALFLLPFIGVPVFDALLGLGKSIGHRVWFGGENPSEKLARLERLLAALKKAGGKVSLQDIFKRIAGTEGWQINCRLGPNIAGVNWWREGERYCRKIRFSITAET